MVQIWVTNRLKKNFLNKRERMSGERRKPSVSTNRNAFHSHVFHPGVFGFAEMLSYVWFSKPASNPGLTRQPHGLCAFSLLFFSFSFLFSSFCFQFHPGMFPPSHFLVLSPVVGTPLLLTRGSRFADWECYSVLWPDANAVAFSGTVYTLRRRRSGPALQGVRAEDSLLLFWPLKQKYPAHSWN